MHSKIDGELKTRSYKPKLINHIDNSISQIGQPINYFNLKKSQWYSRSKLEEIQQKKIRAIIKYAYNNVEYYHNLFKSINLVPSDIENISDLNKIPI